MSITPGRLRMARRLNDTARRTKKHHCMARTGRHAMLWVISLSLPVLAVAQGNDTLTTYFPLHIGDERHYVRPDYLPDTSYIKVYQVYDTVSYGGRTYFPYGVTRSSALYYRPDSLGNVYQYSTIDSTERIWFKFQVAEGDTYQSPDRHDWTWIVTVVSRHDTVETPAGLFTECIHLFLDVPQVMDEEHAYIFAPGMGIVALYGGWQPYIVLYRATINGTYYPPGQLNIEGQTSPVPAFQLAPNYPNPFNPGTILSYTLPEQAPVRLVIYDILGRPVRTLVRGEQGPGYKSVTWDGTDDRGRPVSSGVYLYRIQAGEFSQTRKMVLLR